MNKKKEVIRQILVLADSVGVKAELENVLNALFPELSSCRWKISVIRNAQREAVGVQFKNVIFSLHDAPNDMSWKQAVKYCKKQHINGKKCELLPWGIERDIAPIFDKLNMVMKACGGDPLREDVYWSEAACQDIKKTGIAWLIGLYNGSSEYDSISGQACVRPVVVL